MNVCHDYLYVGGRAGIIRCCAAYPSDTDNEIYCCHAVRAGGALVLIAETFRQTRPSLEGAEFYCYQVAIGSRDMSSDIADAQVEG